MIYLGKIINYRKNLNRFIHVLSTSQYLMDITALNYPLQILTRFLLSLHHSDLLTKLSGYDFFY